MSRVLVDSGVGYLGNIPYDWNIYRIKNAFNYKKEIVKHKWKNYQLLSLTTVGVKEKDIENPNGKLPESFEGYQLVNKNDLIMCLFDLDCSAVFSGLSKYAGMISPSYKVIECKNSMNPNYAGYYFNYIGFDRTYMHYSKNIRYTLNYEEFSSLPMIFPPVEEQKKIADYLDKKCLKIDEIIKDNNKEIELLNEYKKSKINEVVSFGLKDNRRLEKSNNLFFPYIPQGWKFKKIKYIVNSISKGNGITKDDIVEDGDIQCIRYGEIYTKYDNYFYNTVSKTNINKVSSPKYIKKGDIICACTGELPEEIGKNVLYLGEKSCLVGGDIIVINHNQNAKYLNYLMNCFSSQAQKSMGKTKLKVVHISGSEIGNIRVPLPPIEEQKEIADFLDKLYIRVNKVIEYRKQIIEKLEEYKKSLIYECVTGKREV